MREEAKRNPNGWVFEFQVDCILQDGVVVGRNGRCDVPLGTVFTTLGKSRFEVDRMTSVDLGLLCSVDLLFEPIGVELVTPA